MRIGVRECRAASLDINLYKADREGLSDNVIPEQSLHQGRENCEDLGSGEREQHMQRPWGWTKLDVCENSKEAVVTAARKGPTSWGHVGHGKRLLL